MGALAGRELRRFTADEVLRMVERGILDEDERLELLDGALVVKEPQGPDHAGTAALLADRLREAAEGRLHARTHSPIAAGAFSLPEPDVALCRGPAARYRKAHPGAGDLLLVVEIAAASAAGDLRKAALYARAGVAECWVLDLAHGRLHVLRDPRPDGTYARAEVLGREDAVAVPGTTATLPLRDLIG